MYQPPRDLFASQPQAPPTTIAPPPAPSNVTARASSTGGGGFGFSPDFSGMSPQQLQQMMEGLSNLTYSVPLGGYIFGSDATPESAYVRGYYGQPMTGGNPAANRAAGELYGEIGNLPTINRGSPALMEYQQGRGISPTRGPSMSSRMGALGPYQGPWTYPGYDPFEPYRI